LDLAQDHPLARAASEAIRSGDVESLKNLIKDNPGLATGTIRGAPNSCDTIPRTLLHVATDWPGNFPNGAATIAALIEAGAGVNARITGPHPETPLHWAASCDDVEVLDALLDRGADMEAPGAVIGGGTPLADAVAFGQWRAARRLVERGALTGLWQAAALGLMDRVKDHFNGKPSPAPSEVTKAFRCACHGGQRGAAEYLLSHGADMDWVGYDGLTPVEAARRSDAREVADWLRGLGAKTAVELR